MDALQYFRLANEAKSLSAHEFANHVRVNLITNFTDGVFQKILTGMCVEEHMFPKLYAMPYKQYQFDLKNPESPIYQTNAIVTYIFFDASHAKANEFVSDPMHAETALQDIRRYAKATNGTIIINTCILPYETPYGNLFREDPLYASIERYNHELHLLSQEQKNVHILETNRIVHQMGEHHIRDHRNHYACDAPFTHAFTVRMCREWMSALRALIGRTKKCIVLDLDNTLWGGIVGEVGSSGVSLGPEFPGNAFVNFQQTLRAFSERGILLAINSRNNLADAMTVIERHPHMVLREKDFAAIRINWNDKAENLRAIAEELNIGLESLVFLDDDPVNRALVRAQMPEVLVPEFSLPPEHYVQTLLSLNVFTQLQLTTEDRERGKMYAEERQRKLVRERAQTLDEYIAALKITMEVRFNDAGTIARAAQLTQKTNQFNLTTKRYTEQEIQQIMAHGGLLCTGEVTDAFGAYGTTHVALVQQVGTETVELDTFLMSCRVIGRGVERTFLNRIFEYLAAHGVGTVTAWYIPTAKNEPCRTFLSDMCFQLIDEQRDGSRKYILELTRLAHNFVESSVLRSP